MKTIPMTLSFVVAVSLLLAAGTLAAEPASQPASTDWPQWRGPTRNGVVPNGSKLLHSWPKEGPKLLWKTGFIPASNMGGGFGQPVVAEGKVFVYATWRHPLDGGDGSNGYIPITPQTLRAWGYLPDMPADLVKKIEVARLSPKNPRIVDPQWTDRNWWSTEKEQDERAARLSKTNPKTDAYIHDFLATLDPKDAEKYGAYVKRRFYQESFNPEWSTFTWDEFARLTAALGGKRFQTLQEYQHTFQKAKFRATGGVWNSWYMASKLVDTVICLDGATGKELWKKAFPLPGTWEGVAGGETLGPATTPAVWASKCYVGGQLGLYCLSAKDGALLWQKTGHGCHGSPLVADSVVVYGGGYDAETGKLLWGQGVGCGHSSPVLWTCAGKSYAICGGTCLDLHTGKTLWSVKCDFGYGTTPVINGDTLVANSGAYKLTPDKAELLWKMPTGVADPASTPVVHQDHLYVFHSWYDEPFWYCLDMKTGQVKWKQKTVLPADDPCSSLVLADGKIIHAIGLGHAGETFRVELVRATPEEFAQLGAFDPKAAPMSSPAVAGGRLYLRLWDSVACYDLTGKR